MIRYMQSSIAAVLQPNLSKLATQNAKRLTKCSSGHMPSPPAPIVTVGHGRATETDFADSLPAAEVKHLVAVRTAPGRRHNPQIKREAMYESITAAAVSYRCDNRLGGA